ncbi:MAG TPA: tRNA threonylcarbamoyladenosine dehydratase [Candidatus Intestinimonas stercoravium]|nr:tRNA threonylcarbamoyladenosine dehydratase [Candidatus Intestinimonas stercoravium]
MNDRFLRIQMLLGEPAMERLAAAHVCVLGLGGVGSWCAEALARSGVGALTLMDQDRVELTNLNRQAQALTSTLGLPKAEAMARRVADISPACKVRPVVGRYEPAARETFFSTDYDYIVDAIDLVSCKLDLIETALARKIPILSALGTGNKLDAAALRVSDISKTEGCPLARVVRKELRARGIHHHKVVWSPEPAHPAAQPETPPPGRRSVPASVMWVPAAAGLLLAGEVVMDLTAGLREGEPS